MKNLLFTLATLLLSLSARAGEINNDIEMADPLYANGKIYVVVGVIALIFTGIVIYMASIDRKLGKLEKQNKK